MKPPSFLPQALPLAVVPAACAVALLLLMTAGCGDGNDPGPSEVERLRVKVARLQQENISLRSEVTLLKSSSPYLLAGMGVGIVLVGFIAYAAGMASGIKTRHRIEGK